MAADAIAAKYLRVFRQGDDFLNGGTRWCLWLVDASSADLRSSAVLRDRLSKVAVERQASRTISVRAQAATPALFTQIRQPLVDYLAVPETSSERRRVVPAAYLSTDVVAGNALLTLPGAPLWLFGVLQSAMWMAWLKAVGGRLESRIRFSPDLTYCTFPFPDLDDTAKAKLTRAAQSVLDARAVHPGATLADLYDPLAMPANLVKAHDELDRVVDSLFVPRKRFRSDADRLSVLFERYQQLTAPLTTTSPARKGR